MSNKDIAVITSESSGSIASLVLLLRFSILHKRPYFRAKRYQKVSTE
jgi:hypothetical protein